MNIQHVQDLWKKTQVIATAAVTWLTVAGVVIQAVVAQVGGDWPWAAEYGARALIVIGAVTAVIRRVAPVEKADRGVLPA